MPSSTSHAHCQPRLPQAAQSQSAWGSRQSAESTRQRAQASSCPPAACSAHGTRRVNLTQLNFRLACTGLRGGSAAAFTMMPHSGMTGMWSQPVINWLNDTHTSSFGFAIARRLVSGERVWPDITTVNKGQILVRIRVL